MSPRYRVCMGSLFLAQAIFVLPALAGGCLLPDGAGKQQLLTPAAPQRWALAGGGLVGANALYNIENDDFWKRPESIAGLKELRISTLRFPGGELADRYDWERNAPEHAGEAASKSVASGQAYEANTDYKEFLKGARDAGVKDLFFVVNVDGAFRAPGDRDRNIAAYAEKAARWVAAVRKMGGGVRYWEIGNEPYLGAGYPLTAVEYARVVKVYAKAMRAADPTILIGAAGPGSMNGGGFADELGEEGLRALRERGGNSKKACRGKERRECIAMFATDGAEAAGKLAWWPTLVRDAGGSFDFAVVHRYGRAKAGRDGFPLTVKHANLKGYLRQATGLDMPIALTEWNTPDEKRNQSLDVATQLFDIAVQAGNNAVGGVDFAHYWPMHAPGESFKPLLDGANNPTDVGRLFGLYGDILPGAEVAESSLGKGVYFLQVRRGAERGYVVINDGPEDVRLRLDNPHGRQVERVGFSRAAGGTVAAAKCAEQLLPGKAIDVGIPSGSMAIVKVIP